LSSQAIETGMGIKHLRFPLLVAKYVALLSLLAWIVPILYYVLVLASFAVGNAARTALIEEGLVFLLPATFATLELRHLNRMLAAVRREDVDGLKKLNSSLWMIVGVIFSFVVPGVILLLEAGKINRLNPTQRSSTGAVLEVVDLKKYFRVRRSFSQSIRGSASSMVHAVDGVTFGMNKGEVFGLAGESGSGKTTVLRTALMLTEPTAGSIFYKGQDISKLDKEVMKGLRPKIQVVFQDPYESVNPRMPVFDIIAEGLYINKLVSSREEAEERVLKALREVQITPPEEFLYRYPHELSGGQRQRVAIARALIMDPDVILADEPVSMLDVSIRAEVINVLLAARAKRGIGILMVTHDLALSKDMVDQLAIMYLGKIVESGPAESVVSAPYHPYTHALVAAVPVPDPSAPKMKVLARGEIPTNISPPSGCRFHPRCPYAQAVCSEKEPPLEDVGMGRKVACHFWKEASADFARGLDAPVGK
jgi:peptide/nickel transport system ATP-binding protein